MSKYKYNPFDQVNNLIIEAILAVYGQLSPENLSCDGEASHAHMQRTKAVCDRQLKGLQQALGQPCTEGDAYAWYKSYREYQALHKKA